MYNILQFSLKEYVLEATSSSVIYYRIKRFVNKKYIDIDIEGNISPSYEERIFLPEDGVYKLEVSVHSDFSIILDRYIIHNITELLKVKQDFLTKVLTTYSIEDCNHNQYYDFISFHILLESYNKLVKETFSSTHVAFNQLYEIEYLFNRLKEF